MSEFRKCSIYPLNPGVIEDQQTAPSVGGKVVQEEPDSPTLSSNPKQCWLNTRKWTYHSFSQSQSQYYESSGSELLSDILVLPQPKERGVTRRGVNRDAVCITEPEFVEQMKSKELEKQKKPDDAEQKRLEREQKLIEKGKKQKKRKAREPRKVYAEEFNLWKREIVSAQ